MQVSFSSAQPSQYDPIILLPFKHTINTLDPKTTALCQFDQKKTKQQKNTHKVISLSNWY